VPLARLALRLAAWADRGGRRSNPRLVDIDSTAEAIGLVLARGDYDFAIIDTPPARLDLMGDAISQADFVLTPCRASALDLAALDDVIDLCGEHGKPFSFVLNAVHPKRKLTKTAPAVIRRYGPLCETMIADRKA
jgi:chromosome partitioning protein